jgi:hypothetical protein
VQRHWALAEQPEDLVWRLLRNRSGAEVTRNQDTFVALGSPAAKILALLEDYLGRFLPQRKMLDEQRSRKP